LRVRFGDCVFDATARALTRAGQPVHLAPKSFRLLELLLSRRPRPVTKSEIRDVLWPATAVGGSSLARVVADLRSAIGDDARRPRLVRTVHDFGYSFAGEILTEPAAGLDALDALTCRVSWGEREIALGPGEHVLGRMPDASVWIDSTSVSRRHARIVVSPGDAVIEDLGSKNGTYVGGKKVTSPSTLSDGDTITVGSVVLKFRAARVAASTQSVAPLDPGSPGTLVRR
jgi:DNA-binding winged helix-turn-helix (wHTH) protein